MSHANGGSFPGTPDNSYEACGAVDPVAKFPELVHYECKACRKIVSGILLARKPPATPERPAVQEPLFDDLLRPRALRAR